MSPLVWMRAVRDAVPSFTTARLAVLWALGIRMDASGTGFASHPTLAADAGSDQRTAQRATTEARDRGFLVQTRRGRRLGNGAVVASEWRLSQPDSVPPQPDRGDTLRDLNPSGVSYSDSLNTTETPSQHDTGVRPRAPITRAPASSSAAAIITSNTDASNDEATAVVELIRREKQPRSLVPFLRRLGEDGELPDWLNRIRQQRATAEKLAALREGWHCERCRTRNQPNAEYCTQCHALAPGLTPRGGWWDN